MPTHTTARRVLHVGFLGIGAAVAVAALAIAILALSKDQTDAMRIRALQAQVRLADENETQNRVSAADQQLSGLQERVAAFVNCIPELQAEIGGLSINWHVVPLDASEDSFNVVDGQQISKDCESTLYGGSGEHSPLGG
jgi:hypothetical protein